MSAFILIIIVGVFIWWIIHKRKKKNSVVNELHSNRKNKDEVWKTIKQYMKDNEEYGKEIVDSYVVKRNNVDYINPNWTKHEKENKNAEIKIRSFLKKQAKKEAKANNKFYPASKIQDLYVVAFLSRDTKSLINDEPRVIECEVINEKINRKEWDRKILINGALNYDEEMEWIAPVKSAEKIRSAKVNEKSQKAAERQQSRMQAKLQKEKDKAKKNANKPTK